MPNRTSGSEPRHHTYVRIGVAGAVLAYAAMALLMVTSVRPFRPADESANVGYIMSLVDNGTVPHADDIVERELPGQVRVRQHTAKHPPLYYALAAPPMFVAQQLGHPLWGFFGGRLLSVVAGSITVVLVGVLAREVAGSRRPAMAIAAATYAATLTPFVVVGGLVHNDALSAMWATLALLGLAGVFFRGFERWPLIAVFVGCAGGLLTRVQAVGIVGVCGLGLVLAAGLGGGQWSWRRTGRGVRWGAALAAACLATSGWFYWHNIQLYGDPTGGIAAAAKSDRFERGLPFLDLFLDGRIWLSLVLNVRARLGHPWHATDLSWSLAVLGTIGLGVLSGAWRTATSWRAESARPRLPTVLFVSLLALVVVEMVVMAVRHLISGGNLHNRYMFPAIGAVALAAAAALLALPFGRRGLFVIGTAVVQVGLSVVYIGYVAASNLPPQMTPAGGAPESTLSRLRLGLDLNDVPASPVFLWVLLAAAAVGVGVSAFALWRVATTESIGAETTHLHRRPSLLARGRD